MNMDSFNIEEEVKKIIGDDKNKINKIIKLFELIQEINKNTLVDCLNELFAVKDISYGDLNNVIPFDEKIGVLRKLEKKYDKLGIARFNTGDEGVSILSLIATITDFLCNARLGVNLQYKMGDEDLKDLKDRVIEGVQFLEYDKKI